MDNNISQNAKSEYKNADKDKQKMLEKIFGKEFFSETWMELWHKFLKENKLDVALPYSKPSNSDEESANAYVMLIHIVRAKNKGWKPNWNDSSEYKYVPWFNMETNSGSRFSCDVYGYWDTATGVGSRLCFHSVKVLKETVKEYLPIYEKYTCQ